MVDHYLAAQTREQKFSGTVLIAQRGKILLAKAYGWADEGRQMPNRLATRFGIGSITKQFTGMAILLLQEQGKLRVEDFVCSYVSGCPTTWKTITLRNLLTHTSGILDYARSLSLDQPLPLESLLAYLERQPLDFPPGSRFAYSNSGYFLLGLVIEKASGGSYSAYLQREIFEPLHLSNSGNVQASPSVPNLAVGYQQAWTKAPTLVALPLLAAGSLYSTVEDLYGWDSALFNHTFATPRALAEMFKPQVTACNSAGILCDFADCSIQIINCFSYGYGWLLQQLPVKDGYVQSISHTGGVPGFASLNYYYPDQNLTVIVLSNLGTFNQSSMVDIVDLAFF